MSSHEEKLEEVPNDKNDEQVLEYHSISPPSNISYYDLSPYVNTAEVFNQNIIQLKEEIGRILKESDVTDPILLEATISKEIQALTGYDPTKFSLSTSTIATTTILSTSTEQTEKTLINNNCNSNLSRSTKALIPLTSKYAF